MTRIPTTMVEVTTGPWDPDGLAPDNEWVRPVERGRPAPPPGPGPAPRFGDAPRRDPTDPRGQRGAPLPRDPTDPRGHPAAPRDPTDPRGQHRAPPRDPTDPRGRPAVRRRPPRADGDDGGERPVRRSARDRSGLPLVPTLVVASLLVVLAFVVGRVTGGGDDGGDAVQASSVETTTTTEEVRTHTVKSGESLLGIASQYGVTAEALAAANGITNQNHVFVGQVLTIPDPVIEPIGTTTTTAAPTPEG